MTCSLSKKLALVRVCHEAREMKRSWKTKAESKVFTPGLPEACLEPIWNLLNLHRYICTILNQNKRPELSQQITKPCQVHHFVYKYKQAAPLVLI